MLCILCCRYAYYLRNKIFHGELPDFSFNFSQGTQDDKRLDKINLLLEDLNYELFWTLMHCKIDKNQPAG